MVPGGTARVPLIRVVFSGGTRTLKNLSRQPLLRTVCLLFSHVYYGCKIIINMLTWVALVSAVQQCFRGLPDNWVLTLHALGMRKQVLWRQTCDSCRVHADNMLDEMLADTPEHFSDEEQPELFGGTRSAGNGVEHRGPHASSLDADRYSVPSSI